MIKCGFCGYEFEEKDGHKSCSSCPMNKLCNKIKCPNCGFEIPKEPKLVRLIRKWGNKGAK